MDRREFRCSFGVDRRNASRDDRPDRRRIGARTGREIAGHAPAGVVVAAGELGLRGTVVLIEGAALFVGNDSGPMHLPSALGVPLAAFFGPALPPKCSGSDRPGHVLRHGACRARRMTGFTASGRTIRVRR